MQYRVYYTSLAVSIVKVLKQGLKPLPVQWEFKSEIFKTIYENENENENEKLTTASRRWVMLQPQTIL